MLVGRLAPRVEPDPRHVCGRFRPVGGRKRPFDARRHARRWSVSSFST